MANTLDEFQAKFRESATEEEREWLILQFALARLSPTVREAVGAAAIPHWFDRAFLRALLVSPNKKRKWGCRWTWLNRWHWSRRWYVQQCGLTQQEFNTLINLPFVEEFGERNYNVHERTRTLLLHQLWENNRALYRQYSAQAADYCSRQDLTQPSWCIEQLYHLLLADSPKAVQVFIDQGLDWHNSFEYDKLSGLTRTMLEAVHTEHLVGEAAAWTYLFQARLDILHSAYQSARTCLESALAETTDDNSTVKANCLSGLGDVHLQLSEYAPARECYQSALSIYQDIGQRQGEANCLWRLGNVHVELAEYDQALALYQQAAQQYRDLGLAVEEAGCFDRIANLYCDQERYEEALVAHAQVLQIAPSGGYWYHNRAGTYIALERYDLALQDLDKAEATQTYLEHILANRGVIATWQKQPQAAVEYLHTAVNQIPADGSFHCAFALALLAIGKTEQALTEWQTGLQLTYRATIFRDRTRDLDRFAKIYGDCPELKIFRQQLVKINKQRIIPRFHENRRGNP